MLDPNFVYLGVLIQIIGPLIYIIDTVKGKVQPNRVSWLLWSFAPIIAFFAMIQQGVGIAALSTLIIGIMPVIVFLSTFVSKQAYWKISNFDLMCGGLSIFGLILWQLTTIGNLAILFSILADSLAAIPTILKAYQEPESENGWPYITGVLNMGIALLTLQFWNFQNSAFAIYWLVVSALIFVFVQFKVGTRIQSKIAHK